MSKTELFHISFSNVDHALQKHHDETYSSYTHTGIQFA